jgi:hypothetical protein
MQLTATGKNVQSDAQPPVMATLTDPWTPTYRNWTGTIFDNVAQKFKPRTLYELTAAIQDIEADPAKQNRFARAVGATWSFSDITRPGSSKTSAVPPFGYPSGVDTGFIIDTTLLAGSLQHFLPDLLKPEFAGHADPATLDKSLTSAAAAEDVHYSFYVEAGITVTDLNRLLDHYYGEGHRLALPSTVGGSGQTVAGAFSTGTHGAEPDKPTLADLVQAIYLVGPEGEHFWIEPGALCDPIALVKHYPCLGDGPTTPRGPVNTPRIIQNNPDVFDAVLVSFGSMGVIYAVILKVIPQFGVIQQRRKTNWQDLVALTPDLSEAIDGSFVLARPATERPDSAVVIPSDAKRNAFVQLVINPYRNDKNQNGCFVTNRFRTWERAIPYQPINGAGGGDVSKLDVSKLQDALNALIGPDLKTDAALIDLSKYQGTLSKDLPTPTVASCIFEWMINYKIPATEIAELVGTAAAPLGPIAVGIAVAAALAAGDQDFGFNQIMEKIIGIVLDTTLSQADVWDVGYKVGDVETWGTGIASQSIEVAFGSAADAIKYVDIILDEVNRRGDVGEPNDVDRVYLAGYISVRVCQGSAASLALAQFAPHSFVVEFAMLSGTASLHNGDKHGHPYGERVLDFMTFLQTQAMHLRGMLHWGMSNELVTNAYLSSLTGVKLANFTHVRSSRFHKTTTFDNDFTRRLLL